MIDTLRLYEDLAESLAPAAARKIAVVVGSVYEERGFNPGVRSRTLLESRRAGLSAT